MNGRVFSERYMVQMKMYLSVQIRCFREGVTGTNEIEKTANVEVKKGWMDGLTRDFFALQAGSTNASRINLISLRDRYPFHTWIIKVSALDHCQRDFLFLKQERLERSDLQFPHPLLWVSKSQTVPWICYSFCKILEGKTFVPQRSSFR